MKKLSGSQKRTCSTYCSLFPKSSSGAFRLEKPRAVLLSFSAYEFATSFERTLEYYTKNNKEVINNLHNKKPLPCNTIFDSSSFKDQKIIDRLRSILF